MHQSTDKDIDLIKKFPEIKLPSKFYRNTGSMKFTDEADSISGSIPNYSNGAIYADLDNDGDLDLVVNSIDGPALIYRNNSGNRQKADYLDVRLHGPEKNLRALGSKLILFSGKDIRTCEKYPVRGFMSSMDIPCTWASAMHPSIRCSSYGPTTAASASTGTPATHPSASPGSPAFPASTTDCSPPTMPTPHHP
ncbi:FG-GAP-like repeat-containing protein [Puia sp. P3]|uniref:FG-GAP-like repeat-containing protein n=1 Tax=Puia sp. P3 TaxID=3423952 RepID=UPI003D6742C1